LGIKVPPEVKEGQAEDGTKIREIKEKNEEHRFELLEGLPIHGALFDMAGFKLPEISSVPTAKQTNDSMMTTDMLQGLMGQVMSMSQMFQGLMGNRGGSGQGGGGYGNVPPATNTGNNRIEYITQQYERQNRPELAAALQNLSILCQGYDIGDSGSAYFVNKVVDPNTYLQQAESLLLQCETLDDMMTTLNRLQYDTTLFGRENLRNYEIAIDTAWGAAKQVIDFEGEISILYDANTLNNINTFANTITSNNTSPGIGSMPYGGSGSGSGGGGGGSGNMFGQSSGQIMEMMKRLAPQGEQNAKDMHEKLNTDQDSNKLFEIVKKTINGGNPLDPSLFKGMM
jgi:hypothetical protein